jgi:hypothetical protein
MARCSICVAGLKVTAVDGSPGAIEVCRRRGVADVRLGEVKDPPGDRRWPGVLLCSNFGLGNTWAAATGR